MAKKAKEIDLADVLAEALNKQSKGEKVAFVLGSEEAPTNVSVWVSVHWVFSHRCVSGSNFGVWGHKTLPNPVTTTNCSRQR